MRTKRVPAYDEGFYDTINPGSARSASVVVPLVLEKLRGRRPGGPVIEKGVDVGCGEGVWTAEFERHGVEMVGLDGEYIQLERFQGEKFIPADLSTRLPDLGRSFDLAISLEVAEHLPVGRAASFVQELCGLADVVMFSAAVPGQGGVGHVNEQWQSSWARLFELQGYMVTGELRWLIWDNDQVENWYRQNLLIAARADRAEEFDLPWFPVLDVVHPVLWKHHKGLS